MDGQDPEPVVLPSKGLDASPLGHVPNPDALVLRVRDDHVLLGVEHDARHVVRVPPQGVHLPGLGVVHSPQLDLPVVRSRYDEGQRGVERRPVHSPVVTLENVLDDGVASTEELRVHLRQLQPVVVGGHGLLLQPRDVPHPDGLVQGGGDHQVLLWVEGCAHHVVVVPRQNGQARPRLPVPDPNRLVVRSRDDPRALLVKLDHPDVIQVAHEREETPPEFVIPNFDLVVVSSAHEEGLLAVKVHSPHRAVVLLEAIDERAHAVVPQLDDSGVQTSQDPWPLRVEGEPLDAVALRFELCQHGVLFPQVAMRRAKASVALISLSPRSSALNVCPGHSTWTSRRRRPRPSHSTSLAPHARH
mmetsp:Transcript_237/g.560  ORF Transcript_237/g.560 Transcript_237/m.560 type:complete len:358 (+) Transcript_237:4849-5922(+)